MALPIAPTASTIEPRGARTYLGDSFDSNADFTVFFEIPSIRAIILIDKPSARRNRRISAQSSTVNIPFWSS